MELIRETLGNYIEILQIPSLTWSDIVEILIIAFLLYHIIVWVQNTRAFALVKGLLFIGVFIILAWLFNMTTILWIVQNVASIAVIALIVILQPELRSAMEELGQKKVLSMLFRDNSGRGGLFSDSTISEIVRACVSMARVKTGALIVIRQSTPLREWERTGIDLDAVVSRQLLINIFEKNTPLHDGAVIIAGDRVVAATCYLPLSDNKLDKDLGTRHRAGVGISEVTDSLTIIVSEETGKISIAYRGNLELDVTGDELQARLVKLQDKEVEERRRLLADRKEKEQDDREQEQTSHSE
jgi:diadenylate cyclase